MFMKIPKKMSFLQTIYISEDVVGVGVSITISLKSTQYHEFEITAQNGIRTFKPPNVVRNFMQVCRNWEKIIITYHAILFFCRTEIVFV